MGKIIYKKMSLFDSPLNSIIIHGCNAQGVWGSGIAKEFKIRYPKQFESYKEHCDGGAIPGNYGICSGKDHNIGWIITSENYGSKKDSVEQIKINTTIALLGILDEITIFGSLYGPHSAIYSNKFNSGLFAVPWEDTELILETVLKRYPGINWVVCDPDL